MIVLPVSNHLLTIHFLLSAVMLYNILFIISCLCNDELSKSAPITFTPRVCAPPSSDLQPHPKAAFQMSESFELQDMLDRPQKPEPPTAAIDSDDADGTITAWSLAVFALSVLPPCHFLVGGSPLVCQAACSRRVVHDITQAPDIYDGGAPDAPNTTGSLPGVPIRYPVVWSGPWGVNQRARTPQYFLYPRL